MNTGHRDGCLQRSNDFWDSFVAWAWADFGELLFLVRKELMVQDMESALCWKRDALVVFVGLK